MLSAERAQTLAEILSLTIAETEAAQAGRWQQVRSMDRRRLELLDIFFASPPETAQAQALGDQLRTLVREDARLLDVVNGARNRLAARIDRGGRQRAGIAAYEEARAQGAR